MIDISSRKFQVILYKGTDQEPWDVTGLVAPDGISITRQPLTPESPPIVEGQLTLLGDGAESLNPRENLGRFLPGNLAHIQLADSTGTLRDAPFGARLRIAEFDFDDGRAKPGEPPKSPQITIYLTDKLGQARELEPPQDAPDLELGVSTPIKTVVERFLAAKGLTLVTVSGDPVPTATTKAPISYTGKDSVIEMAHKYLWCAPDAENQSYYLWVDNQEQVRIGALSWTPATAIFETEAKNLVLYKDIQEEKEKLPGKVRVTGVGKVAEPRQGTEKQYVYQYDDQGALYCTTVTWTTVGPQGFSEHREVYLRLDKLFPDDYEYPGFYFMALAERVITAHNFLNKRKNFILESTWLPRAKIDRGDEEFPNRVPKLARNSRTDYVYTVDNRLDRKTSLRKACRALTGQLEEDQNPFELVTEATECESWKNLYGGKFCRTNTSADGRNRRDSSSTANEEALPPAPEMQPEPYEIVDKPLEFEIELTYPDIPAGTIKRTKVIDLGEFVLSQVFCERLAKQEAKRVMGAWLAKDLAFAMPDELLLNGWPPGLAVFAARGTGTSDTYLGSGEVITLDQRQCVCGLTGLWLGTRDTEAVDTPPTNPITVAAGVLLQEVGDEITQESEDSILL